MKGVEYKCSVDVAVDVAADGGGAAGFGTQIAAAGPAAAGLFAATVSFDYFMALANAGAMFISVPPLMYGLLSSGHSRFVPAFQHGPPYWNPTAAPILALNLLNFCYPFSFSRVCAILKK